MYRFIAFLLLLGFSSCNYNPFRPNVDVVAEVNGHKLLKSEVTALIPAGPSREDSLAMLRQYVNSWALNHLMLAKAQSELPKEQRDVSQALEEYRRSLLIFRYEKSYIEDRIDTVVTAQEIDTFYKHNPSLFALSEPIIKARYVKMSSGSPYLEMVRSLYRTQSTEETYQLEQMAHSSAEKYDTYNNQWISLSTLASGLPLNSEECAAHLGKRFIECQDNFSSFFVAIIDYLEAGKTAPIEYEEASIRNIILGKRKQELLRKLEQEVVNEGWNTKRIKSYFDENE